MTIRVALCGNPNSGKTSLFNCITGANQKVGNWGGVTVEIKEGTASIDGEKISIIDLPGTYSLSAYSLEEQVARDYIVNEKPDVVVDVIDATNLDRHLYLALQLMELGVRPVLVLNMWDEVTVRGLKIDINRLGQLLGLKVVTTNAKLAHGIRKMLHTAVAQAREDGAGFAPLNIPLPGELSDAVDHIEKLIAESGFSTYPQRWMAIKLFEHDKSVAELIKSQPGSAHIIEKIKGYDSNITQLLGDEPESLIAESRFGFISGAIRETVTETRLKRVEISDQIDKVLTHKFWAYPVFAIFMWLLFQVTFKIGEYPMTWIELLFTWMQSAVSGLLPPGVTRDLLTEGVIAGVGGVAVFLPNILILFLGISIMEDTGYMARAAFIMDRLMHKIGLHGKSFIPMIMGLGCSVPAIMAARTLESEKDRVKTILLTPMIACSARLPVFVLFAGALFPKNAGNVVFLFQVVFGFCAFVIMGYVFKHTLFRGSEDYPFVMELPPYRVPTVRSVVIHMWHKAKHYIKKMGGVVLVFSIILWWAGVYPKSPAIEREYDRKIEQVANNTDLQPQAKQARIGDLENKKQAAIMERTVIGRIGKAMEPVVRPFGTDWRGAVSLATGFVAKEIVVGSMGVLYAVGDEVDEGHEDLRAELQQNFTPLAAFAFMMFVLLYTPCIVALLTLIKELKSWKWSVFSVGYQFAVAWIAATVIYQLGSLIGL
ncbi:MAG: ferrous iron transport protein B [Chitinivibrionales bacterium]|nr:ferrous iron transport protein B [Chitinivibrionales bacterium]